MLRASSDATGSSYELDAISQGKEAGDGNIPHGALLVELADATFARNEEAMARLRTEVADKMGADAVVDACGVIANFQRMVRIADGTGIPLDDMMMSMSSDIRPQLGLDEFEGAANTHSSASRRLLQKAARPLLRKAMRGMSHRSPKSS
jgi:DNA-binding phage protein